MTNASAAEVPGKSRIARIRKMALLPGVTEPQELAPAETLGFPFFDETDTTVEFDIRPESTTKEKYRAELKNLAAAIAGVLTAMRIRADKAQGRIVFLAEATAKLAQIRANVKDELIANGHHVVPQRPLLKDGTLDTDALEEAIGQASYAIHLFGDSYGVIPDGSKNSLAHAQYQSAANAKLPQIAWIMPDADPDERQKEFLRDLRYGAGKTQVSERRLDLCEIGLSEFKEAMIDILAAPDPCPPPVALKGVGGSVYLLFQKEDIESQELRELRRELVNVGFPVALPVFQAQPGELRSIEEQRIVENVATIIYYGNAQDAWVDQKRKFLINSLGKTARAGDYSRAVYVSPPKTPMKELEFGDFLGRPLLDAAGLSPLLVLGDFGPFSRDKLKPLIESLTRSRSVTPSPPVVTTQSLNADPPDTSAALAAQPTRLRN